MRKIIYIYIYIYIYITKVNLNNQSNYLSYILDRGDFNIIT